MTDRKLATLDPLARLKGASRATLLRACNDSGFTQDELGKLVGTDARGVRRLQRKGRKRADRLDLLTAIWTLGEQQARVAQMVERPGSTATAQACSPENTREVVGSSPIARLPQETTGRSAMVRRETLRSAPLDQLHETALRPALFFADRWAECTAPQLAPARACTENTVTCHGSFSGWGVTLRGGAMWDVAKEAA